MGLWNFDWSYRDPTPDYRRKGSNPPPPAVPTRPPPPAAPPPTKKQNFEALKKCIDQIVDLDTLSSQEYKEKYGEDADFDPYVIATKAKSAISD